MSEQYHPMRYHCGDYGMEDHEHGDYVHWADYDHLRSQAEELQTLRAHNALLRSVAKACIAQPNSPWYMSTTCRLCGGQAVDQKSQVDHRRGCTISAAREAGALEEEV